MPLPDRFDDVPAGADSDSSSELDIIEIAPGRRNINCLDEAELRSRGLEEGTVKGSVGIEDSAGILPAKHFLNFVTNSISSNAAILVEMRL